MQSAIKKLLNDKRRQAKETIEDRLDRDIKRFDDVSYNNALNRFHDWLKLYLDFVDDDQLDQGYITINAETCPNIVYSLLRNQKFIQELADDGITVDYVSTDYLGRPDPKFRILF